MGFQVQHKTHGALQPRGMDAHQALGWTEAAELREPHRRWVTLWACGGSRSAWASGIDLPFSGVSEKRLGWQPPGRVRCWFILQHVWSAPPFLLRPLRFLHGAVFASCLMLGPDLKNDLTACLIVIHCKSLCCNQGWLHGKLTVCRCWQRELLWNHGLGAASPLQGLGMGGSPFQAAPPVIFGCIYTH